MQSTTFIPGRNLKKSKNAPSPGPTARELSIGDPKCVDFVLRQCSEHKIDEKVWQFWRSWRRGRRFSGHFVFENFQFLIFERVHFLQVLIF